MVSSEEKIEIFTKLRKFSADSLYKVLKELFESGKQISEVDLRDAWLKEVRTNKEIFGDGWYMPPPHGVIVLFGKCSDQKNNRINYKNARPKDKWPREDIYLDKENSIISVYVSPVDKKTGIIGDFAITLYFGKDEEIINHLKTCYKINKESFAKVEVGMKFKEFYSVVLDAIDKRDLVNGLECVTDKSSNVAVMGHTIPWSYEEITDKELTIINGDDWVKKKDLISGKRKFINNVEELIIKPGMAFSIEPRLINPSNPKIPMVLFHTVCVFHEDGSKEFVTDFEEIFKLTNMNYILEGEQ